MSAIVPDRATRGASTWITFVFRGIGDLRLPVEMVQAPGDDSRLFIVEHPGVIRAIPNDPAAKSSTTFLDRSNDSHRTLTNTTWSVTAGPSPPSSHTR